MCFVALAPWCSHFSPTTLYPLLLSCMCNLHFKKTFDCCWFHFGASLFIIEICVSIRYRNHKPIRFGWFLRVLNYNTQIFPSASLGSSFGVISSWVKHSGQNLYNTYENNAQKWFQKCYVSTYPPSYPILIIFEF